MADPNPASGTTHPDLTVEILLDEDYGETNATAPSPAVNTESGFPKHNSGPWFSLDDIPPHQWENKFNGLSAWMDNQVVRPDANSMLILIDFMSRTTGFLRDRWQSLGEYRQLQFLSFSPSQAIEQLHFQFLGKVQPQQQNHKDYFAMKCCSLKKKDLDSHY